MSKYDFDGIVPRKGTNSVKWDYLPSGVEGGSSAGREDIIPMWVADMDFKTAPCIIKALQERVGHGVFGYTHVPESYYESVASWFSRKHGWRPDPSAIICTPGVVPAISAVIKALTVPGEKVILQTPVYNCFFSSIRNNECIIADNPLQKVDLGGGEFTYEIDFEDLKEKCKDPLTKVMLLCNPHNPAGRVWTTGELEAVGEICREHGVTVISDEIHCEIVMEGSEFVPFASVSRENQECCVTLNSPSKAFNTAGLQIANIICSDPEMRKKIDKAVNVNEVCDVNPFGVLALQAAYSPEGEEWQEECRDYIQSNYDYVRGLFMKEIPDFPVAVLEGTYLMWLDCSVLEMKSEDVARRLLEDYKVWVNPGTMYGTEGFIRINIACPKALLMQGARRIVEGLQSFG